MASRRRGAAGRVAVGVVSLLLASAASPPAYAQTPPSPQGADSPASAPPPPTIVLPVVKEDEGAIYPQKGLADGVREDVVVVVTVDIDPTGHVKSASVAAPVGHGFDEAALTAARKLVFTPATRNGKPIASRVDHSYAFPPPRSKITGHVAGEAGGLVRPIAGGTVAATGPDGIAHTTTTDPNGAFTLEGLRFGRYSVEFAAPGYGRRRVEEDLQPGEELEERVRLDGVSKEPTPDAAIAEVEVKGTRPPREVTRRTLEQRELERIPGTNGDALRALQNLPGLARPPGIAGLLIVRGSGPQDTNVFVDGTLVPIVYHFGGLSSVVPTEAIDKLDFYPGNFSAEYGRVTGGVVDVALRDPKTDKLHGLLQADFIDARTLVEGPIGNSGWNFMVAGRRSYVDLWLKPVLEAGGSGVTTAPVYYDYQALLQRKIGRNGNLRFAFFGSDDRLDILTSTASASQPGLSGGLSSHTGFWRIQGRYKDKLAKDTEFRLTSAVGEDLIELSLGDNLLSVDTYPITTRAEVAQRLGHRATLNMGLDFLYTPYDVSFRFPPPSRAGEPPAGPFFLRPPIEQHDKNSQFRPGVYTELELQPWKGGRLVPGLRLDYSKETDAWDLAPRINARQDLTSGFPRTTLKGGVGVFFQPPQPQETSAVFGQPGLTDQRAIHYDIGVEQEFTKQIDLSLEGFYKQLDRLVVVHEENAGRGSVVGLELLLRYKPDDRFFGWVAYTLSRSVRQDSASEPVRLAPFDQTHILTVLGSYRLGRGWEFGGRFRLVSGNPNTPSTYGFYDENAGSYLPLAAFPPNSDRLPLFHQLDLRVDKGWKFPSWRLSAYADVQNVYNQGNVEGVSYNYNYTKSTTATGLPFLPSLGLRGQF